MPTPTAKQKMGDSKRLIVQQSSGTQRAVYFHLSHIGVKNVPHICTPKIRPVAFSNTNLSKPLGLKTSPRKHSAYNAIPSPASMPISIAWDFDRPKYAASGLDQMPVGKANGFDANDAGSNEFPT
jgi:hypothetical protein